MALNQLWLDVLVLVAVSTAQSAAPVLKPDPPHTAAGKWARARHSYSLVDGIGYYRVYDANATWGDAWLTCLNDGGHLATIESKAEEDVIVAMAATSTTKHVIQIGFHSLFVRGQYTTIQGTLLEAQDYVPWATGEPSDWDGTYRCGAYNLVGGGGMYLTGCDNGWPFACEHDV